MLFTRALILSTLTLLITAQTTTDNAGAAAIPTSVSGAQETKMLHDLESYLSSLTSQPEYTSVLSALESAIPSSVLSEIEADPSDYLNSVITGTATPSWYSAIPTSYQSYLSSVGVAEASIVSKDATGPAATHAPVKVVGAVLAVGAAGLALL